MKTRRLIVASVIIGACVLAFVVPLLLRDGIDYDDVILLPGFSNSRTPIALTGTPTSTSQGSILPFTVTLASSATPTSTNSPTPSSWISFTPEITRTHDDSPTFTKTRTPVPTNTPRPTNTSVPATLPPPTSYP